VNGMGRRVNMTGLTVLMVLIVLTLGCILTGCADRKLVTVRSEAVQAFEEKDYQKARELFDKALSYGNGQVDEIEFDILRYRAERELRLGDYEAAEKTYQILSELDTSEDGRILYGNLQEQFERLRILTEAEKRMDSGSYEEAYALLEQLAGLGGDAVSAAAWFDRAVCAEYMGNWDVAAELFGDYIAIYPEDTAAKKEYDFCITR